MPTETTIITRADDCGSNHSANAGIEKALKQGVLRNVSVMATCPAVLEAAGMFASRTDICFGLHFVLNAEWDDVKWGPVSELSRVPSLVEANGYFSPHPRYFREHPPVMEEVILELEAQYGKLMDLGFPIRYVDTHMVPEWEITGLEEKLRKWCSVKELIYWGDYLSQVLTLPSGEDRVTEHLLQLETLKPGQSLLVTHPAVDSCEMRALGNAYESGPQLAINRQQDMLFWSDARLVDGYRKKGIRAIRYDEAIAENSKDAHK